MFRMSLFTAVLATATSSFAQSHWKMNHLSDPIQGVSFARLDLAAADNSGAVVHVQCIVEKDKSKKSVFISVPDVIYHPFAKHPILDLDLPKVFVRWRFDGDKQKGHDWYINHDGSLFQRYSSDLVEQMRSAKKFFFEWPSQTAPKGAIATFDLTGLGEAMSAASECK